MKKQFYTIGSVVILLLAAFIFVLLPAMVGNGRSYTKLSFGSYNGKDVSYAPDTDFTRAASQYEQLAKWQAEYQGLEYQPNYFDIFESAFESTVTKMAYTDAVEKSGWKPSEQAVDRIVVTQRDFIDEATGAFSQRLYSQASDEKKRTIRKEIESSLIASRYYEDVFGGESTLKDTPLYGLKASADEISFLRSIGSKERTFDMVAFDMSQYPAEQAAAYGAEHKELFASYNLSVITTADKANAEKALERVTKESLAFGDAVAEYSSKNYSGDDGKLRNKYFYQLKTIITDEADLKKVTDLTEGQTSGVIAVSAGYAVFHADGNAVQPDFADETIIKTVTDYIKSNEYGRIEDYYTKLAQDFSAEAALSGFDAACEVQSLQKIEVPAFPLNYSNVSIANAVPSIKELAGAGMNENFLTKAFSLTQDQLSEPIVLGNYVLVLKMTGESDHTDSDDIVQKTYPGRLRQYDQQASQRKLLTGPKVKNNVYQAVIQFLTGGSN